VNREIDTWFHLPERISALERAAAKWKGTPFMAELG
jgi:transposase